MMQQIGVFIIVTNKRGQFLLGKRKNGYKAGYFGFPGGRVEVGENVLDCAKREILEETGINATQLRYEGVVKENQGEYDFIHFVCKTNIGDQLPECSEPDKCEGWQWFDEDQLPEKVLPGHLGGMKLLREKEMLVEIK